MQSASCILLHDWSPLAADGNANFWIYERPKPGRFYCAGIDVAQGLATGDWSVIMVYDRTDGTFYREARSLGSPPEQRRLRARA